MPMSNESPRFDGNVEHLAADEHDFPTETGVLPQDFPERLVRLRDASGLTWSGMSRALGVDPKQMYRWRRGTEPCGGAMHSLFRFATRIPEGMDILMGRIPQMKLWDEGD